MHNRGQTMRSGFLGQLRQWRFAVLWSLAITSMGLLLGFLFRVPTLLAASTTILLTIVALGLYLQWPIQTMAIYAVALLLVLQFSYFVGALLNELWFRIRKHARQKSPRLSDRADTC
jgi:hypothetical protein